MYALLAATAAYLMPSFPSPEFVDEDDDEDEVEAPLRVYELQPIDVGLGRVRPSLRRGVLVSEDMHAEAALVDAA